MLNLYPALNLMEVTSTTNPTLALLIQVAPFVVLIAVFYFMLIRPQRKKEKEESNMRNSLEIGDVVTTRGGIVGSVTGIRDDIITIETGASKVRITVQRWAIASREEKMHN